MWIHKKKEEAEDGQNKPLKPIWIIKWAGKSKVMNKEIELFSSFVFYYLIHNNNNAAMMMMMIRVQFMCACK